MAFPDLGKDSELNILNIIEVDKVSIIPFSPFLPNIVFLMA